MPERLLIVGRTSLTSEIIRMAEHRPRQVQIAGVVDLGDRRTSGSRAEAVRTLAGRLRDLKPDRIVVDMTERRQRLSTDALLEICMRFGVRVEEAATCYERLTGRVAVSALSPGSIVFSWPLRNDVAADRFVGRVASAIALILLAPLMAVIAAAIKLDSRGPVFFVQERVGAGGRPFRLFKFRTMHVCESRPSEWERDNQHRVTRVGRVLRRLRLDELPQLLNVIRAEMTLVGPRPHPVTNLDLFTLVGRNLNERTGTAVACYALRSMVAPGVTGWAQVRYRYANNLDEEMEKLQYDLYYVKYRSRRLDLRIICETARVMLFGSRTPPSFTVPGDRLIQLDQRL